MADLRLPGFTESYAVLIGTGTYGPRLEDLPGALRNLHGMRDVLLDSGLSGFLDSHITRVLDPAQPDEIMAAVSSAGEQAADVLLVYYAGHGLLMGESSDLHLGLTKSQSDAPWTALDFRHLSNGIKRSKAVNKILILDCCYSGRARKYLMADDAQLVKDQLSVEGIYVMTATSNTGRSTAPPEALYTAFTGKFIEVVRQGVTSPKPLLSMSALFEEVRRQMRAASLPLPEQCNTNTVADLALTRNAAYDPEASPAIEAHPMTIPVGQWVWDLAFTPDGRYLAIGSRKWLSLWDSYTGSRVWKRSHGRWHDVIYGIAFSPDGKYLAGAVSDNTVKVWKVDTGELQSVSSGMQEPVYTAFSPDGLVLAAGFTNNTALIWDATASGESQNEEFDRSLKEYTHPHVASVALSIGGRVLASAGTDCKVRVWDVASGQELIKISHRYRVSKIVLSADAQWLAIVSPEVLELGPWIVRTVHISSRQDGPKFRTARGPATIAFRPDGKRIAISESEADGSITRVWDHVSGQKILEIRHAKSIYAAAFSPDGERLAIAGAYFAQILVLRLWMHAKLRKMR